MRSLRILLNIDLIYIMMGGCDLMKDESLGLVFMVLLLISFIGTLLIVSYFLGFVVEMFGVNMLGFHDFSVLGRMIVGFGVIMVLLVLIKTFL